MKNIHKGRFSMKIKKKICNSEDGFLVQTVFLLFYYLERLSLFYWVRFISTCIHDKLKPDSDEKPFVMTYIFPEIWVVCNMTLAYSLGHIAYKLNCNWLLILIIAYAIERVLEMFVYQVNVLFFHRLIPRFMEKTEGEMKREARRNANKKTPAPKESQYYIKSATRTVLMLILNMVEYVLQFALIFTAIHSLIGTGETYVGITGSFQLFMNMTSPKELSDNSVLMFAYVETIIGMFMNIICLARFVGMLPEVKEKGSN